MDLKTGESLLKIMDTEILKINQCLSETRFVLNSKAIEKDLKLCLTVLEKIDAGKLKIKSYAQEITTEQLEQSDIDLNLISNGLRYLKETETAIINITLKLKELEALNKKLDIETED